MSGPPAFAGRVLILGASGMLGHALLRELAVIPGVEVFGTARSVASFRGKLPAPLLERVVLGVDGLDLDSVRSALDHTTPDVVVNCIGIIKQDPIMGDLAQTVHLNALLPHQLARECDRRGCRLVQVSTDCVFSGRTGRYSESDLPDPSDFYGRSKLLGEVHEGPHLTVRTSIVGHELGSARSLIDWFLSQHQTVKGFTGAIFSGLTTVELAHVLAAVVLPARDLSGLFHVASSPISKYDLLNLIAAEYDWPGTISSYDGFECDRTLSDVKLRQRTGYEAPAWPEMVRQLHESARAWGLRP